MFILEQRCEFIK